MTIKLGIITPESHMDYFRAIEEEMRPLCQFRFLTISNFRETTDIYLKNLDSVDGFVISGRMLYEAIDKEYLDDKVPVHILHDDENLLYRSFSGCWLQSLDLISPGSMWIMRISSSLSANSSNT